MIARTIQAAISIAFAALCWDYLAAQPIGLSTFTPHLILLVGISLFIGIGWLAYRRIRDSSVAIARPGMIWAASNLAVLLFFSIPVFAQSPDTCAPSRKDASLRILSANLWNNQAAIPRFLELVETNQPDLLFVQEAYEPWRTELSESLLAYDRIAGCNYPHNCNAVIFARLGKADLIEGDGNGYVAATLALPANDQEKQLTLVSVHLGRGDAAAMNTQMALLRQLIGSASSPVILAGDFNLTPWDGRLQELIGGAGLARFSGLLPTWPTPSRMASATGMSFDMPGVVIDHVFASDVDFAPVDNARFDFGSDHYAVQVDLSYCAD